MENFWLRKRKEKEAKMRLADTLQFMINQALGGSIIKPAKKKKQKLWLPN